METQNITLVKSNVGVFAFTRDDTNNLVYQEIGKHNNLYFAFNGTEAGNISDDWEIVDMRGLDDEYKSMVEIAIERLK